jgi:hypothetical protein
MKLVEPKLGIKGALLHSLVRFHDVGAKHSTLFRVPHCANKYLSRLSRMNVTNAGTKVTCIRHSLISYVHCSEICTYGPSVT